MKESKSDFASRRLLIVDDDKLFGSAVADDLTSEGFLVSVAHTLAAARLSCLQNSFDAVLLDHNLPDGSGLELVPDLLHRNDRAKIILVTAFPTFDSAVEALKNGVYDYISKPIDLDELRTTVERALRAGALEAVEQVARYRSDKESRETALVGAGRVFAENLEMIRKAAKTNASVLITGETGTGKNVVAKAIHYENAALEAPFISVNCAALPENLIEAELFGAEKGAFTGAHQTRKGTFELADGGTLFLDEIGEMPFALQAKLLSALEDRRIRRIGGNTERPINVRVIAATNAAPERGIAENRFRPDLYYRLSVLRIHLAPLREQLASIPELCRHFIKQFAPGRDAEIPLAEIERLQKYDFPGNVRELRNIIERCLILQDGKFIYPSQIINFSASGTTAHGSEAQTKTEISLAPSQTLAKVEREHILATLAARRHNFAHTADSLDISLSTLKRKLREYGIR